MDDAISDDDYQAEANCLGSWQQAIAAIRLIKVIRGDALPRENESIDLILLTRLGGLGNEQSEDGLLRHYAK